MPGQRAAGGQRRVHARDGLLPVRELRRGRARELRRGAVGRQQQQGWLRHEQTGRQGLWCRWQGQQGQEGLHERRRKVFGLAAAAAAAIASAPGAWRPLGRAAEAAHIAGSAATEPAPTEGVMGNAAKFGQLAGKLGGGIGRRTAMESFQGVLGLEGLRQGFQGGPRFERLRQSCKVATATGHGPEAWVAKAPHVVAALARRQGQRCLGRVCGCPG
mmetsp:Transcript_63487/g.176587  ORF Transcript_63487/g.176587 Transcript_63487/m.176587 type:complete len:216 (+) Transcript_63487:1608-2255(+)